MISPLPLALSKRFWQQIIKLPKGTNIHLNCMLFYVGGQQGPEAKPLNKIFLFLHLAQMQATSKQDYTILVIQCENFPFPCEATSNRAPSMQVDMQQVKPHRGLQLQKLCRFKLRYCELQQ